MRFSYLIASNSVPHERVAVAPDPLGTRGMQSAAGVVPVPSSAMAARPFSTLVGFTRLAAVLKFAAPPKRYRPSAWIMSFSALVKNGKSPLRAEPVAPDVRHEWNRTKS